MSDFMTDRPRRKVVRPKAVQIVNKIYLLQSSDFLMFRDKEMKATDTVSEKVVNTVVACRDSVFVLAGCSDELLPKLKDLNLHNLLLVDGNARERTGRLKKILENYGVRFRPIRNVRAMSYLNLHKFIVGDLVTCVSADDYSLFNILPDKEATFDDMVKKRRVNAWV